MGKTFLIIVLAVVVWWMWRRLQVAKPDTADKAVERPPESMVRCAYCGVNQPRSECVEGGAEGELYCSDAHRREAESRAGRG